MPRTYSRQAPLARFVESKRYLRRPHRNATSLGRGVGGQAPLPRHVLLLVPRTGARPNAPEASRAVRSLVAATLEASSLGVCYLTVDGWDPRALCPSNPNPTEPRAALEIVERALVNARVRVKILGDIDELETPARHALENLLTVTATATALTLTLAVTDPNRSEIVEAAKALATRIRAGLLLPEEIDAESFRAQMGSAQLPPVDLLIRWEDARPAGEFLPFETRHAYVQPPSTPWGSFGAKELALAIHRYRRGAPSGSLKTGGVEPAQRELAD
jgi:Putative undecaprenyl diphosphate synthase